MDSVEIYPYIVVYKNTFKDIEKNIKIFKRSQAIDTGFWSWSKWSTFGKYIVNSPFYVDRHSLEFKLLNKYIPVNELEQEQLDLTIETCQNIYKANEDYMNRYNFKIDIDEISADNNKRWQWSPPNFCSYDQAVDPEGEIGSAGPDARRDGLALTYHSDFVREPIQSPGYKFVFTSLVYYNDDYSGGEIDFCIGNKLLQYKPEAGDILVFPSGNPDYFTEDGKVYIHAAKAVMDNNKYFARSYWTRYYDGDQEWHLKQKEFGIEKWKSMHEEMMKDFRKKYPNRTRIEGGIRIR